MSSGGLCRVAQTGNTQIPVIWRSAYVAAGASLVCNYADLDERGHPRNNSGVLRRSVFIHVTGSPCKNHYEMIYDTSSPGVYSRDRETHCTVEGITQGVQRAFALAAQQPRTESVV